MKFDVIGVGCCAADFLGIVPKHPPIDVKMQLLEFSQQGGGPVATALVTLSRLGCSTGFVGCVGNDELGLFEIQEFKKEGVDVSHLKIEKGARSQFAFIMVDRQTGKRTILWSKPETTDLKPEEMNKKYITSGSVLHLDGFHPEAALEAARWAKESGMKIVLDAGGEKPGMDELVKVTDYLVASEVFARDFGGDSDLFSIARSLLKMGPEVVVITRGKEGSLSVTHDEEFSTPAFPVKAVDTTGAGDVFHGGFIYGLFQNWSVKKMTVFASAVAAIKCLKLGGRAGIPTRQEVDEFLKNKGVRI